MNPIHRYGSLDEFRYIAYKKAIRKTPLSSTFQLATLPPTTAAAKQHSFRTYLTVQEWMGRSLQSTSWGWKLNEILTPIEADRPVAPDTLLNMIDLLWLQSRWLWSVIWLQEDGVPCSALCTNCSGQTCNNAALMPSLLNDEGETEKPDTLEYDDNEDDEE